MFRTWGRHFTLTVPLYAVEYQRLSAEYQGDCSLGIRGDSSFEQAACIQSDMLLLVVK